MENFTLEESKFDLKIMLPVVSSNILHNFTEYPNASPMATIPPFEHPATKSKRSIKSGKAFTSLSKITVVIIPRIPPPLEISLKFPQ